MYVCARPLIEHTNIPRLCSLVDSSHPFTECTYFTCSDLIFRVHTRHEGCLNLAAINSPSPPSHATLHPPASFFSFFFPLAHVELIHSLLASLCSLGDPPSMSTPPSFFLFFPKPFICSSAPDSAPPSLPCAENLCVKLALRKAGPWPCQSPADFKGLDACAWVSRGTPAAASLPSTQVCMAEHRTLPGENHKRGENHSQARVGICFPPAYGGLSPLPV
ncbi:hypothetical protein GGI42DRAFT_139272 [Trichoderma sp. SZMC 28013]